MQNDPKILPNRTQNAPKSRSGGGPGGSWSISGHLGRVLGYLGGVSGHLGGVLGRPKEVLGGVLGRPGAVLGGSRRLLGRLGASWGSLVPELQGKRTMNRGIPSWMPFLN